MACLSRTFGCAFPRWLTAAAVLLALSACGGGGSNAPATLTLAASATQVLAGGKPAALTAAASTNAGTLNWSLGAASPGSLSAATGAAVNYLPPAAGAVSANSPVTVTVSGTGISRSFALTVYPDPGPPGLYLIAGDINRPPVTGGPATDVDGRGANAVFSYPEYIAADPAGSIYVTEKNESRAGSSAESSGLVLRKIAVDGTVTTVFSQYAWAPQGTPNPLISKASGIAFDQQGNLYMSDASVASGFMTVREGGGSVLKITPAGVVSVFAGKHNSGQLLDSVTRTDGVGENARFGDPFVLGFDADGNLYVNDGTIRKITPDRVVTTVAALPAGFGADAEGNVYISERAAVLRVAPDGSRTIVAGVLDDHATTLGPLPGRLAGGNLARLGPASFAVISGAAIVKLVLPH